MPTKAGLPGWFPEDFSTDPELHAAFDDSAGWHAKGRTVAAVKSARRKKRYTWQPGEVKISGGTRPSRSVVNAARTWDDLSAVIALSAETGRLAVTPAPYGKPGGPGLYGVKSNKHSDYFEHIVQALMRAGHDKGSASAIAWGALRRWRRGGGKVHPEVRAAATGALAEEKVAQARAHAHAVTWDDLGTVIELAAAASGQARVPAGQAGGGQFGSGGGQTAAKPAAKAAPAKAPAKPAPAGQQKQTPAQAKQNLLNQAATKRQQAAALTQQITAAQAVIAAAQAGVGKTVSAASNATSAQSGSTTSTAGSTTASSAPATASTTPAAASTPAASSTSATAAPAATATTAAITQLQGQVKVWQGQVTTLMAQATALTTLANKIGG